jgi:hypothetical protein
VKRKNGNPRGAGSERGPAGKTMQAGGDFRAGLWRLPSTGQLLAEFAFAGGGGLIARRLMGASLPGRSRAGLQARPAGAGQQEGIER